MPRTFVKPRGVDAGVLNKAVAEMDKVVQKNATSAEESASASEELNAQAETMKGFMGEPVAVVGSSRNRNDKGVRFVKSLIRKGGNGKQTGVINHPKAKTVFGRCFPEMERKRNRQ